MVKALDSNLFLLLVPMPSSFWLSDTDCKLVTQICFLNVCWGNCLACYLLQYESYELALASATGLTVIAWLILCYMLKATSSH